jgi:hypothetical protein
MKPLIVIAILSSISSLNAQSTKGRQIAILDLTAPDVVRTSGVIGSEGGVTSTARPQSLGLDVRFVSSGQSDLHLGDRFAYELEVRNSGTQAVDFPFSSDLASFLPGPNTTVANIYLQVRRHDQRAVTFGSMMLAGSDSVPGSLHRLQPADTLLIRVPAGVSLDGDDFTEFSARAAIPVNVVVTFNGNEAVRWIPAVSKNSLQFVIRR